MLDMDIRQLIYFNAIVEEGSITKAAERLHMAQPPLSQQLKLLEDELGIKLVERNTRKIQITDAGMMLLHRSKQILELMDTTIKELKDFSEGIQGTLSIGTIASAGDTLLPERIYSFHKNYPEINFQVRECSTYEILELLKSGVIEIGIIRTPFNSELFDYILLADEPMVAATSNDLYLDGNPKEISLLELANKPLLVHNRYETKIIEACEKMGFEPRILGKIDDTRTILLWAATGMGIAVLQRDWIDLIPDTKLKYFPINEPSLVTGTAIVWMKNRYITTVARNFLETFRTF
jgi:LysR family transcriptional regulator, salicylic acid-responsive activator of bsdBCD